MPFYLDKVLKVPLSIKNVTSIVPLDKHIKLEKDILSVKDAVRVSICHTATVIANGFMHSGTTHDQFLRLLYYIFIL